LFPLKKLKKMQQRAAVWILNAFCTSPTERIEALVRLISIHLHFKKLSSRVQLRVSSLPFNHTIWLLLESQHSSHSILYCLSLENITSKQRLNIKSSVTDANTCLNGLFPSFNTLNSEFSPGFRLIDKFHSQYSFHWVNCKNKESKKTYLHKLDDFFSNLMVDSNTAIVILYASIKNNITTSITHVHLYMELVKKTTVKSINGELSFSLFSFLFLFFFSIYFLLFLFLEHKVRVSDGHKSQDAWKDVEGSRAK